VKKEIEVTREPLSGNVTFTIRASFPKMTITRYLTAAGAVALARELDPSPVSYGAARAMWDMSVERGLNLSRADVLALLQAAEPLVLAEHLKVKSGTEEGT
jgi:hypothetical protein